MPGIDAGAPERTATSSGCVGVAELASAVSSSTLRERGVDLAGELVGIRRRRRAP